MTCVAPGKNFFDGDRACCFAKLLDVFDRLVDLLLPLMRLGDDAGDRPAMPGDDDRLTPLDLVEQLGSFQFNDSERDCATVGEGRAATVAI